ncbi:MAG: hypothetical protein EG828_02895 [Deltaproteobacteria bacterium]|nr:hypothetical protein [Deltaproteobacteria bacterium]
MNMLKTASVFVILSFGMAFMANSADPPSPPPGNTVHAAAFSALATAISSTPPGVAKTIVVSSVITVNDLTIPSNIVLQVVRGGGFIIEKDKTLTINGPFEAGLFQIFQGTGRVAGLKSVHPEWWGARRDGTTDDGEAIRNATSCVNASGGGSVIFSPGTYRVYNAGQTYTSLGAFVNCAGINLVGNGTTLAQDPARVYTESNGAMFIFSRCRSVTISGFNVTGPRMDITASKVKGNEFVQFNNGSEGLVMVDNILQGVTGGLLVKDNIMPGNPCRNIQVSNLYVKQSWYGITGQNSGSDMVIDNLTTDTIHRSLFIYGISNVKATIHSKDAYSYDVFLNSFVGSKLENIEIFYDRTNVTRNSHDGSQCIRIQASDAKAAIFRNIRLHLDIRYNETGQTGAAAVRFSKMTSSGTAFDAYEPGRGHRFENIEIDGIIDGNSHYGEPVIFMDTLCKWGNGDYFSDIKLTNLTIKNNNRGIVFYTGPFIGPLVFDNVNSSTPVHWGPNDSAHTWNYPLLHTDSDFPNKSTFEVFKPIDVIVINTNASVMKGWSTKKLTNAGATSHVHLFLPDATPGLVYTISNDAAKEIRIKPKEMESIGGWEKGKYLLLDAPRSFVIIKCVKPGEWMIGDHNGTLLYEQ